MTNPTPSRCPLCAAPARTEEPAVADFYFGYPGTWRFDRCTATDCAIAWIADPLPHDRLAEAYARYYTHDAREPGLLEMLFARWINRRARRHGDRFPAMPLLFREAENRILDTGAIAADPDGLALDVGCGSGERLGMLRAIGWGAAQGFDYDPVAVARGQAAGRPVHAGSAEELPVADASAALVLLHHVVEHLADIRPALVEAARVLRPGGHVVITTPNLDAQGRAQWGRWWRGYEAPRHLRIYTLPSLRLILEQVGYTVCIARTSARAVPFMNQAAAMASGAAVGPSWVRWWHDDRAILAAQAHIGQGEPIGEEIFIVARRR